MHPKRRFAVIGGGVTCGTCPHCALSTAVRWWAGRRSVAPAAAVIAVLHFHTVLAPGRQERQRGGCILVSMSVVKVLIAAFSSAAAERAQAYRMAKCHRIEHGVKHLSRSLALHPHRPSSGEARLTTATAATATSSTSSSCCCCCCLCAW